MEFEVASSMRGSWVVVAARGELDLYTVALLKDELAPLFESGARLIFDFTELRYLDSSAIGVVVGALKKLQEKGGCTRVACSEPVRRVFESTGLHKQIGLFDSLSEAASEAAPTSSQGRPSYGPSMTAG